MNFQGVIAGKVLKPKQNGLEPAMHELYAILVRKYDLYAWSIGVTATYAEKGWKKSKQAVRQTLKWQCIQKGIWKRAWPWDATLFCILIEVNVHTKSEWPMGGLEISLRRRRDSANNLLTSWEWFKHTVQASKPNKAQKTGWKATWQNKSDVNY